MAGFFKRCFYLPGKIPLFTGTAIVLCLASYLLFLLVPAASPVWLGVWGFSNVWDIYRDREIWGLLSNSFVHQTLLHLVFNLFLIWKLGGSLEAEVGTFTALLFWMLAAFVSSAVQLLFGAAGMGASGVIYATFGYLWAGRGSVERFRQILDPGTIRILLVWLVFCLILSWTKVMPVGNAAHISGFAFGFLMGYEIENKAHRRLAGGIAALLLLLSIGSAFYAPWSSWWCAAEGYRAYYDRRDMTGTAYWLNRVGPQDRIYPEILTIRAEARSKTGEDLGAIQDLEQVVESGRDDPKKILNLNNLAWFYSTRNDPNLRNGDKAVYYALQACRLVNWRDPGCLDTLAAAYAASGKFDEAVKWQLGALNIAKTVAQPEELKDLEKRLQLYQKHRPYLEK